jgi:glutathione peroxidase
MNLFIPFGIRRPFAIFLLIIGLLMIWPFSSTRAEDETQSAYDFTFHKLMGSEDLPLSAFRGKVILVVNTASKCGFTPQYQGLEKLYDTYRDQGLVIVGVPSNDFGGQEPGSDDQIAEFCKLNYGVSFPMASKEDVVGDNAHPFYKWACKKLGVLSAPKWNFHKYLISRNGQLVDFFISTTTPDSPRLIEAIQAALNTPPSD